MALNYATLCNRVPRTNVSWKRVTDIKLDGRASKIRLTVLLVNFVALISSTAVPNTAEPQAYFLYKETSKILYKTFYSISNFPHH